jgi:ATP-dependent Clp protease protease subunit
LRELTLNGYIDDEVWFGDEITPESLHESLYGSRNEHCDDVHIRLNSYGGSCNAAVRMFDDIRAYPGSVSITVSGTAASAATMLCMAADRLEMTPGSLFMIHDPSMMAFGNERDLTDSINLLRTCKESILNMYERRVRISRNDTADMMTAATWMDSKGAFERGFVDAIADDPVKYPVNAAEDRAVLAKKAEEGVQAWLDRKKKPTRPAAIVPEGDEKDSPQVEPELNPESAPENDATRVKVATTDALLEVLKY